MPISNGGCSTTHQLSSSHRPNHAGPPTHTSTSSSQTQTVLPQDQAPTVNAIRLLHGYSKVFDTYQRNNVIKKMSLPNTHSQHRALIVRIHDMHMKMVYQPNLSNAKSRGGGNDNLRKLTITRLIMHIHPQRPPPQPPLLLHYSFRFASNRAQQPNMPFP